jgi:ABC-type nitrate/sulfonate/bicarbonate transport system substrate-binding protein
VPGTKRLVFAVSSDKQFAEILRVLADYFDHFHLTKYSNNPRGVSPEKLAAALAAVALAAATLPATMPAQAAEKIVLGKVGAGAVVHWPLYIGEAKGFFAKRGVELDIVTTSANASMQQQLAAGALDIGVSGGNPDPIRAIARGAPNVVLLVDTIASPYSLMSKPDIKTPADLKGRTISIDSAKGAGKAYLDRILKPTGLKQGDYDLVFQGSTPARLAALKSGAADAAMVSSPYNFYAEEMGFPELVLVSDVVKDFPFAATAANRAWVMAHEALARNYVEGYIEAVNWFYDPKNRDEAIKLATTNTSMKQADVAKTYDFFQRIKFFNRSDAVSKTQLNAIMDVLIGFHDLDKRIDVNRLIVPDVTKLED